MSVVHGLLTVVACAVFALVVIYAARYFARRHVRRRRREGRKSRVDPDSYYFQAGVLASLTLALAVVFLTSMALGSVF
jgi:uncharacterized membrane-anchored protein